METARLRLLRIFAMMLAIAIKQSLAFASPFTRNRLGTVTSKRAAFASQANLSRSNPTDVDILDPLVVCGPSGVGKGTIIQKFMDEYNGKLNFGFTTSHTTRAPRDGEVDGVHYNFVNRSVMEKFLDEGYFIESAEVHGNYYGTSWNALRDVQAGADGKRCLLDIDVQGVKNLKKLERPGMLEPKYIFIAPPSIESLQERLLARGSESAESLAQRVGNAADEVAYGTTKGTFDAVIVNDDLDTATSEFAKVVRELYAA